MKKNIIITALFLLLMPGMALAVSMDLQTIDGLDSMVIGSDDANTFKLNLMFTETDFPVSTYGWETNAAIPVGITLDSYQMEQGGVQRWGNTLRFMSFAFNPWNVTDDLVAELVFSISDDTPDGDYVFTRASNRDSNGFIAGDISFNYFDMSDSFVLTVDRQPDDSTAPVPEPATMLLLGTGLLGIGAARRKNNQKE